MTQHDDAGGPDGPPVLTDDLVADLHAGVLDDATAARLWPLARADRDAAALLAALDATSADLRLLGAAADTGPAPTPQVRVPDHVAARLDAALAGLAGAGPPVLRAATPHAAPAAPPRAAPAPPATSPGPSAPTDLAAARARRSRRWAPAVGVAAAAVVVAAVGVGTLTGTGSGGGVAGSPQAAPLPSGVTDLGTTVGGAQAFAALGSTSYGPLTDEATRAACLQANGVPAGTTVLGASEVVLDGVRGVLLLLPGPVPPRLTALVVGSACGAGNPDTLARQDIGGR